LKEEKNGMPGGFIEVNDAVCKMLGYSYEEMLKMTPFDIDGSEEQEFIMRANEISREKRAAFNSTHIKKDGTRIPVEIDTHAFDWLGGKGSVSGCPGHNQVDGN